MVRKKLKMKPYRRRKIDYSKSSKTKRKKGQRISKGDRIFWNRV